MKRRVFSILSAGSLGLCVGVVGLWLVSYERVVAVSHVTPVGTEGVIKLFSFTLAIGAMRVYRGYYIVDEPGPGGWRGRFFSRPRDPDPWPLGLLFRYESARIGERLDCQFQVPLWFLTAIFLVAPIVWTRRIREHRRRQKLGLCLQCAYDLRASHDKCPECGLAIPADLVRKPIA